VKRRDFIGSVIAALAAPMLPAEGLLSPAPSVIEWNAATLTAAMEKLFICHNGPVAPLFDMVMGVPTAVQVVEKPHPIFTNQISEEFVEPTEPRQRYRYITYACAIEGGDAKEAEARLAKHFYDEFSKLPTGALVWRVQPQFSTEEITEYGKTWMTREAIEDKPYQREEYVDEYGRSRVRYDFNKPLVPPEGVELDPDSGSYKYVTKRIQMHKMRMRLTLPHLYDHEEETVALPSLFKPEGAPTTVI